MTVWIDLAAALVVIAVGAWWLARRPARQRPRRDAVDADWGDWPHDQMGP